MTLDEAIIHCEEVAQENEKQFNNCPMKYDGAYANNGKTACKCAEEHRQLAEWLTELKQLREQQPVKLESTKGTWIDVYHRGWMCSNCNTDSQFATNFCSFCGAKMVESEDKDADSN